MRAAFLQPKLATSTAFSRVASFVRSIVAAQDLGAYVRQAIVDAGLPLDPKMDWGKWLNFTFGKALSPLVSRRDDIQDIIYDVVIHELYSQSILTRLFDPDHTGIEDDKPLANKVTAFLVNRFQGRVPRAVDQAKLQQGPGTGGIQGRFPTIPLEHPDKGKSRGFGDPAPSNKRMGYDDLGPSGKGTLNPGIAEFDGDEQVSPFCEAFMTWVGERLHGPTEKVFQFITTCAQEGYTRKDMRQALPTSGLLDRNGVPLVESNFTHIVKKWVHALKEFASDPENKWSGTPIARQIVAAAAALAKEEEPVRRVARGRRKYHFQGIPVTVEWEVGETRKGEDKDGKKWSRKMNAEYGFIPGLYPRAGDAEELDVYIGSDRKADTAYFVEQLKDDGSFDEFKCVLGVPDKEAARELYLSHYPADWGDHLGEIKRLPVTELRDLVQEQVVQK